MDNIIKLIREYINKPTYKKESVDSLFASLNLQDIDFKDYVKAINSLEETGIIYITNKGYVHLAAKLNIFIGKIIKIRKYSAICRLNDNDREIVIENQDLLNAYINDIVRVRIDSFDKGVIIDVISHNMWNVVALHKNKEFIVDDKNFPYDIKILPDSLKKHHLVDGHIVLLKINSYNGMILYCSIEKILGHQNDPGVDILSLIAKSGVKYEFDKKLLDYTDKLICYEENNLDLNGRKDLTDLLICTIDGLDAKDLDDAISLTISNSGNYILGVHIADVSHYVKKNSPLDKEAFTRGTSIYLADRVIPMLPFSLCNGICSLNQDQIRLTISCFMEFDYDGNIINYEITPSYIKSKARLDYDDVNNLFSNKQTRLSYTKELKKMLFDMKTLSSIISKKMEKDGYIKLDVAEAKLEIDSVTNKVISISKRTSLDAEKMIENFMIKANETVASHIYFMQLPFIYRVHSAPSKEKLAFLTSNLKEMGLNIHASQNYLSSIQIQNVLKEVESKDNQFLINNMVLRSMSKAYYSTTNIGHFGLGSDCYTHFTSPIRRYPDLVVHRFLNKYLFINDFSDELEFLIQAADQASITERNAISLEREVEDMKKAEYMQNFVGCVYEGIVTGVMDFGFFVQLDNTCEGLVRYESMYMDYEIPSIKIGDKVLVRVISTNISNGEINFAYEKKKSYNKVGLKRKYEKANN